ncbi:MAG TPA: class I SAM-dependent methyltransferase [Thermoanaerobaculia bacterium]|nr:class I SAM-dependent methyltransferase [Thermoanaerobaculia bacterium]
MGPEPGRTYWSDPEKHAWEGIWMNHPAVRERINTRVTGNPGLWPIVALPALVPDRIPFGSALSIGSGLGNFERSLAELGIVRSVTGVDVSPEILVEAERRAAESPEGQRIRYVAGDARALLREARNLDAVFFHASLHHFDRLDELLALVKRALAPRGLLYLDEYVGPSRDEWTWRHLLEWNFVYRRLPAAVRRTHVIRAPVTDEDPTEAIASSDILPAVEKHFRVISQKDYGGNLLSGIYPSLLRPDQPGGPPAAIFDRAVRSLLSREDRLLARGRPSFHAVVVAEPR